MYKDTIKILQELAKSNQEQSKEIGFAIGLVNFCMKNEISIKDNVFELPTTSDSFGYFIVQECTEGGNSINTVNDERGMPLEVNPEALIIERRLK